MKLIELIRNIFLPILGGEKERTPQKITHMLRYVLSVFYVCAKNSLFLLSCVF
jgi:hypothetical protein